MVGQNQQVFIKARWRNDELKKTGSFVDINCVDRRERREKERDEEEEEEEG